MLNLQKLLTKILDVLNSRKLTSVDGIHLVSGFQNQSFNTPEGTGVWYMSGASASSPTGGNVWGMLFQMRSPYSVHSTTNTAVYTQLFINFNGMVYTRAFNNGSWTAWKNIGGYLKTIVSSLRGWWYGEPAKGADEDTGYYQFVQVKVGQLLQLVQYGFQQVDLFNRSLASHTEQS